MTLQPAEKKWETYPPIPEDVSKILSDYSPAVRQLLYNRDIESLEAAEAFLEGRPPTNTDPFMLLGMRTAVDRINSALERGEKIAVYGDYDVDGLTSTALMVDCLTRLGGQATPYIPNRFDEGYGLNNTALGNLQETGISLVISVDCGIRSVAEAEFAREIGLDLIITDHHHPGEIVPPALAVINPRLGNDPYPDKDLTGVGIAYKLACALAETNKSKNLHTGDFLDLVALGTVADIAPLTGENRSLVHAGLRELSRSKRNGLGALMGITRLYGKPIQAQHIGFVLGPRLNAAGRLDSAEKAYRLLATRDVKEAALLAQELDDQNRKRQEITRQTQAMVEARLGDSDRFIIADAQEDYNPGIVGLVASRILNKYYRPTLLANKGEAETTGSCRSIAEFHIAEALDQCEDLLIRHGGHAAAAGFTLVNENWDEFIRRLNSIAEESLKQVDLRPTLNADMEIPLDDASWPLLDALQKFQPTGQKNPEPVFVSRGLVVASVRTVGKDKSHLKLQVRDRGESYDGIAFRMGDMPIERGSKIDLVFTLEANEFMGETNLQLNVKDIRQDTS